MPDIDTPAEYERRAGGDTRVLTRTCSLEAELIEFDPAGIFKMGYKETDVDVYMDRVAVTLEGYEDLVVALEQALAGTMPATGKIRLIQDIVAKHRARFPRVPEPAAPEDLPEG